MQKQEHKPSAWLWPDQVIYKRRSRFLREEHNKTVNAHADLLARVRRLEGALREVQADAAKAKDDDITSANVALSRIRSTVFHAIPA